MLEQYSSRLEFFDGIPDPDEIRRRLAVVATEAGLLKSLLKFSVLLKRERQRLVDQEKGK